jgi:hypothetical protein
LKCGFQNRVCASKSPTFFSRQPLYAIFSEQPIDTKDIKTYKMKKLLPIILSLFTICLNAQTIVDTNKVWNVVTCFNFGGCGTSVFSFGADTTIGIYQYKKLILNLDSGGFSFNTPIAAREDTSTKQVFFYNNGEYLAYDFSLNEGDTFTTNMDGCSIQMTVDSVDSVILFNGELRKRMFLSNFSQETWIEGVGSLNGLTYVGVYFCLVDIYPTLNCFKENDTLKYQNSNFSNCFYNTVDISELSSKNNVKVYPNPFTESTIITFDNSFFEKNTLKIFNTNGQLVKELRNITGNILTIERDKMCRGIYYFQLMNDRRQIGNGKLVIE